MPKYLFTFEKGESVRWLGHLDILRTFERAVRRAGLPIAFSAGFNPRERLAFASALSTGVTGGAERATMELTDALPGEEIAARLNAALPPGLRLHACEALLDTQARNPLNSYDRAEYTVVCGCPAETSAASAERAIEALLAQPEIVITREREGRSKQVDIRPFLFHLALVPGSVANERLTLAMALGQGDSANAKPPEIAAALAEHLPGLKARRIHRARLLTAEEAASLLQAKEPAAA